MTEQELNDEINRLNAVKSGLENEIQERKNNLDGINLEIGTKTTERNGLIADSNNLTQIKASTENEINGKKDVITALDEEIKTKQSQKEALSNEVIGLTEIQNSTDKNVKGKQGIIASLELDITSKTAQKESLNSEINTLNTTKAAIESDIMSNNPIKDTLLNEIKVLNEKITEGKNFIDGQDKQKIDLENHINQLRNKSDLYSNDIAGIGEDNKNQRTKYLWGIGISFSITVTFIIILVSSVKNPEDLLKTINGMFVGNPRIQFTSLLLLRISLLGTLFVLIFVFINLTRAFVAQFIKTQEKMTSLRFLDFLTTKIGKEESKLGEAEKLTFEINKLEKQNEILNKHLPGLIEYGQSSFDKTSHTKSPLESTQDMVSEIAKGVIAKIEKPK